MTARSHLLAAFFVSALNLRAVENLGVAKVDGAKTSASGMPPAIQVIVLMALQYFIVYSLLQILQTYNQMKTPGLKGEWERIFTEAALEVDFGPMLGVLFLAVRMRAQQLWPPDGMVPAEAQTWMYFCCLGIFLKCLVVIVEPWLTGSVRMDGLDKNDPLIAEQRRAGGARFVFASICGVCRALATFFVYVGFTVIIFAIYELPAQPGSGVCSTCSWAYSPAVAPAVACVINLTVQYFTIFGLLMAAKLYSTFFYKGRKTFSIRTLESAVPSLKLCPMLAILFIGARMRALQMNLESPPAWAQLSFYVATYAILVQTICAVLTPLLTGEAHAELDEDGNVVTTGASGGGAATVITMVRYLALAFMIAGVVFSGYSVFAMEAPPPGETPPVSTTIRCVLNLTTQFLTITILYTMAQSYSQLMLGGVRTDFQQVLAAAMPTLQFIPMLCVLFVAVRMRALQLDPAEGAPQTWVQDAMVMTTWAMLVQTVVALSLPFTTGELEGVMIDAPAVANLLVSLKFVGLGVTYVGIATTMYGVYLL